MRDELISERDMERIKLFRLFDTAQFDARSMTRLGFFGLRDKDSVLPLHEPWTNCYLPGALPSGKAMLINGVLVQVFAAQYPFARVKVPALRFATLRLQVFDKIYLERTDVLALSPHGVNQKFDPRDFDPIFLSPMQNFGVEIKLSVQSPGDMHAHSDLVMRVTLIGEMRRAMQ